MTEDSAWLTVPDYAERLGVTPGRVRELLREGHIVAVRRGERNTLQIPAATVVDAEDGAEILATLRGTITLLRDAGFSDDEAMAWLLEEDAELAATPLEALRQGRRAHVRRVAQALL